MDCIRDAKYEDMPLAASIMVTSFRTAFADFVSQETMDASTNLDNCRAMLESTYREGKMHFLMGGDQGFLCWQETNTGVQIAAIHSLPESWGTGLGRAMLTAALKQIGDRPVYLWAFKENARARRFYEKHGFYWDGSKRVSEFDGALEVRYVKHQGKLLDAEAADRRTVILSCESLERYVGEAQRRAGTAYPVIFLNQKYHEDPAVMHTHILEILSSLPEDIDTILVAMGFCGGSWDSITANRRIVLPRVDDCISLLLHTDDCYHPNLKQMGHMYMLDGDPDKFSPAIMFDNLRDQYGLEEAKSLFEMWFANYRYLDIIDTGMADCYSESFVEKAQVSADLIDCDLDYTVGSNHLLEKLLQGQWDEQFLVAEPGHRIAHKDFFD